MKKVYTLYESMGEVKAPYTNPESVLVDGCSGMEEAKELQIFDNEQDALAALANYRSSARKMKGVIGLLFRVTEYYVGEEIRNDDNEFIESDFGVTFAEWK